MLVRMQADASPADIEGVQEILGPDMQRTRIIDNTIVVPSGKNNDPSRFRSMPASPGWRRLTLHTNLSTGRFGPKVRGSVLVMLR